MILGMLVLCDTTIGSITNEGHLDLYIMVQFSGKRMCTILVNRLEDLACPVNVWLGKLTALDMTPLG